MLFCDDTRLQHCDVSLAASKANPSFGFVISQIVNGAIPTAVRRKPRHTMPRLGGPPTVILAFRWV